MAGILVLAATSVVARTALDPPRILDMVIVGQEGASRSTVSRRVFLLDGILYVSGEPGLQAIDVRDPSDLRLASDWTQSSPKMNGSDAKEGVLYVANWSPGEGIILFDLVDPARPSRLLAIATRAHTWDVEVFDDLLYVSVDSGTITGVEVFGISDPRAPQHLGYLSIDDRLVGNACRRGQHVYVTHKKALLVHDWLDPRSPRRIGEVPLRGLGGESRIHRDHIFLLTRETAAGEQGGVTVFSLEDPASPREVEFWEQSEPRDMHFQEDFLVVPASGSGIYTLDVRDPEKIALLSHWYASWPDMGHGGYPVTVAGSGNHVFVGTTSGNDPGCEDFESCPSFGARVYSVQISVAPPAIAPFAPDPDETPAGEEYVRRLRLLDGDPAPTWSVVRGPTGLSVDGGGVVRGWRPEEADVGRTFTVSVRASNPDGSATESWSVRVVRPPEDGIALFRFEEGTEGWALRDWRSGPYDPGSAEWDAEGGHEGGNLRVRGSGNTNNLDTCNREGGVLERLVSTAQRDGIRIEYDVLASLDVPPAPSGTGSCPVLEGTAEDMLVISVSPAGLAGPWTVVQALMGTEDLFPEWSRRTVDLSALSSAGDNPRLAIRFQWQLNTAAEVGRIDNVRVTGRPLGTSFRRGDSNADGQIDISDPIATLGYLFGGGSLACLDAADANDSGEVDISDAIHSVAFSFLGGPPPPAPHPSCGPDPSEDLLGCELHAACP